MPPVTTHPEGGEPGESASKLPLTWALARVASAKPRAQAGMKRGNCICASPKKSRERPRSHGSRHEAGESRSGARLRAEAGKAALAQEKQKMKPGAQAMAAKPTRPLAVGVGRSPRPDRMGATGLEPVTSVV